ncbi:MAG: tetratricopeptide repeat-containing glycosyltransferase family 2 protein [Sulfurihydrogenibium sp.]|uniref:tetratricopeptide repeat-containing glycosyltransferase family 2 protein n=1 Tax=Sulfurihydrogenibium sp. TaxID=2053621 RepID=UPI003C7C336A
MAKDTKVSACIIAKNEEHNLPRLLESIKGKFDEIVLVDTGSTDKTVDIAKQYGAKVYYREWQGFADARQYAVDMATGDWIWFFDADCELEEEEYQKFKRILLTVNDNPTIEGIGVVYKNLGPNGQVKALSSTVHIHRKHPDLVWEGKIHERVVNKKTDTITIPPYRVSVLHYGYADFQTQMCKAKRNLKLIFEELRNMKSKDYHYYIYVFYIVQSYNALSLSDKKYLKKSLRHISSFLNYADNIPNTSTFKKHFYVYAGRIFAQLEKDDEAVEILEKALNIDQFYPDYNYLLFVIYKNKKDLEKAIEYGINYLVSLDKNTNTYGFISDSLINKNKVIEELYQKIISSENKEKFEEEIKTLWKTYKGENIGRLLFRILENKNPKESEKIIKKLAILHNSDDAYADLGEYFYKNGKTEEALKNLLKAIELNSSNPKANMYLSRIYESLGDYEKAFFFGMKYISLSGDVSFLTQLENIVEHLNDNNLKEKFFHMKEKIKV